MRGQDRLDVLLLACRDREHEHFDKLQKSALPDPPPAGRPTCLLPFLTSIRVAVDSQ